MHCFRDHVFAARTPSAMMRPRLVRDRLRAMLAALTLTLTLACTGTASAGQFDISGPAGSQRFGQTVTVLPNGNIVVTDPDWSAKAGAVHLYSPAGALLNT